MVQQIEKQYGDQVIFIWIDIALYQGEENKQLMKIAEEMKVETAPALVLMDTQRKVIQTWQGDVDQGEVSKAIEQVVR